MAINCQIYNPRWKEFAAAHASIILWQVHFLKDVCSSMDSIENVAPGPSWSILGAPSQAKKNILHGLAGEGLLRDRLEAEPVQLPGDHDMGHPPPALRIFRFPLWPYRGHCVTS